MELICVWISLECSRKDYYSVCGRMGIATHETDDCDLAIHPKGNHSPANKRGF